MPAYSIPGLADTILGEFVLAEIPLAGGSEFNETVEQDLLFDDAASAVADRPVSASDTLTFTQTATGVVDKHVTVEQVIAFLQEASAVAGTSVGASHTLLFTQLATAVVERRITVEQTLDFLQQAAGSTAQVQSVNDDLLLTDEATAVKVVHVSVSDVLEFLDTAEGTLAGTQLVDQVLAFVDFATAVKEVHVSVSDVLDFDDTAHSPTSYEEGVSQVLDFDQIASATIGETFVPPVAIKGLLLQAPIPSLQTTCVLPSPKFGDSQTPQRKVEVKRSINGTVYSYVKSNARSKLQYRLTLSRMKALELRAFILAYYRAGIRLTNHKGEIWNVKFTSNPFEFAAQGRDAVEITLEFEGTLIAAPEPSTC